MSVVRFPASHSAVFVMREALGGWFVVAGSFGWLLGSHREAMREARRLAASMGVAVREVAQ